MIYSLEFALAMHQRCKTREVVVAENVFLQVLAEQRREGGKCTAALNRPYGSPRFRFISEACWSGLRFIHVSNSRLPGERSVVHSSG
jgi:hypothetical protein